MKRSPDLIMILTIAVTFGFALTNLAYAAGTPWQPEQQDVSFTNKSVQDERDATIAFSSLGFKGLEEVDNRGLALKLNDSHTQQPALMLNFNSRW